MGVQVTGASSMHWCHHLPSPSPPPSPATTHPTAAAHHHHAGHSTGGGTSMASVFSSLGSKKFAPVHAGGERELTSPFLLGAASTSLFRSHSFEAVATAAAASSSSTTMRRRTRKGAGQRQTLRRVSSASIDYFAEDEDDEEFVQRIQELAFQLQQEQQQQQKQQQEEEGEEKDPLALPIIHPTSMICDASSSSFSMIPIPPPCSPPAPLGRTHEPVVEPPWPPIQPAQPEWPDEIVPAVVEKNANRVELPLSLRIIKEKKKRWEDGTWEEEAADSAAWLCSVKKAFSSMVFIIRELQSYTLQLRQALFYEDLQGILERVQREMNSSFVWLFQQIFSCTPTLMVSVMLLLANFTVYSMGHGAAIAAPACANPPAQAATTVLESQREDHHRGSSRFDDAAVKTFSVGRSASVGGSGGSGGGKPKPVAGATDDGRSGEYSSSAYRTVLPDGTSSSSNSVPGAVDREDGVVRKDHTSEEAAEEARMWKEVLDSVRRMKASAMDEALLDSELLRQFVAPVTVELEREDYSDYLKTELMYQQAVYQEPDNVLLLANFAQFLYLVLHDHDRAEYYFKRAVGVHPADPEALSQYATFLWLGKKDLTAAEETYLEAIAADPGNTVHAANYAHFLWNTGGEDTCFPLDGDDA